MWYPVWISYTATPFWQASKKEKRGSILNSRCIYVALFDLVYSQALGFFEACKKGVAVYEIQRGVQHRHTYNFVYSHVFFFFEACQKGVAVYGIVGPKYT